MREGRTLTDPSQKILVDRLLSWDRVEARLKRYAAIAEAFPLDVLRAGSGRGPFFCHHAAWRLGTWRNESLVRRLDELLALAASIAGWERERSLREGGDFADFWALYWQMQVAEYLARSGFDLEWRGSGPDLMVTRDGRSFYVECYQQHQPFSVELFLRELVDQLGDGLVIDHDLFLPLKLPHAAADRSRFIDAVLRPLLDSDKVSAWRRQTQLRYPVVISRPPGTTLVVYMNGPDSSEYDPSVIPNRSGSPDRFLERVLRRATEAKRGKNQLAAHRPNLVAASFLLGEDIQSALGWHDAADVDLPVPELPADIDAFAFSTIGINEELSRGKLHLLACRSDDHPARQIATPTSLPDPAVEEVSLGR